MRAARLKQIQLERCSRLALTHEQAATRQSPATSINGLVARNRNWFEKLTNVPYEESQKIREAIVHTVRTGDTSIDAAFAYESDDGR